MTEFKEGDVVQLKSGGPKMTVSSVSTVDDSVYCSWFSGSKLQHGDFKREELVKVEEADE